MPKVITFTDHVAKKYLILGSYHFPHCPIFIVMRTEMITFHIKLKVQSMIIRPIKIDQSFFILPKYSTCPLRDLSMLSLCLPMLSNGAFICICVPVFEIFIVAYFVIIPNHFLFIILGWFG